MCIITGGQRSHEAISEIAACLELRHCAFQHEGDAFWGREQLGEVPRDIDGGRGGGNINIDIASDTGRPQPISYFIGPFWGRRGRMVTRCEHILAYCGVSHPPPEMCSVPMDVARLDASIGVFCVQFGALRGV